jgi:hypothetical protein
MKQQQVGNEHKCVALLVVAGVVAVWLVSRLAIELVKVVLQALLRGITLHCAQYTPCMSERLAYMASAIERSSAVTYGASRT